MGYIDYKTYEQGTDIGCDETINNERFEKYGNIMVGLETLSPKMNAVVIEIAAVEFSAKTGEIGEVFDYKVSINTQLSHGRSIDENTLSWWMAQSDKARNEMFGDPISKGNTYAILTEFERFVNRCDNRLHNKETDKRVVKLWGNGSVFNIAILQNMFETECYSLQLPWKYWAVNDVRTIVDLNPSVKENCRFEGTPHCVVDDCKHEIKYLVDILKTIQIVKPEKDKSPRYIDILLSKFYTEYELEDFPIDDFSDEDDTVKLTIDLKEKKLLGWKKEYGNYRVFIKVVDGGTYVVRNSDNEVLYQREGYVPNGVVSPVDGYGDYIDFTVNEKGDILDWYDYDKLDFTDFENDD